MTLVVISFGQENNETRDKTCNRRCCQFFKPNATTPTHICVVFYFSIDPDDLQKLTGQKRVLGRVVIRGPQVSLISPEDGMEEIANPFLAAQEEQEEE